MMNGIRLILDKHRHGNKNVIIGNHRTGNQPTGNQLTRKQPTSNQSN